MTDLPSLAGVAPPPRRLAVTTWGRVSPAVTEAARRCAVERQIRFVEPGDEPIGRRFDALAEALLVFDDRGVRLCDPSGELRFRLGMAKLRRLRARRGEPDPLLRAGAIREGDQVLDCTLGLAQDALVAAAAVGVRGRVVGCEQSFAIHALVAAGLARLAVDPRACRIEPHYGDARALLPKLPDRAFDVVLFDPLFDRPTRAQPGFALLRRYGVATPLDKATIEQARRVARRCVVVKGARYSEQWRRLGIRPLAGSRYSAVVWARLPAIWSGDARRASDDSATGT